MGELSRNARPDAFDAGVHLALERYKVGVSTGALMAMARGASARGYTDLSEGIVHGVLRIMVSGRNGAAHWPCAIDGEGRIV